MAADYCKHSNSEYEVVGGYVPSLSPVPAPPPLVSMGGWANDLFQIFVACVRRVQGMLRIMNSSTAHDAL